MVLIYLIVSILLFFFSTSISLCELHACFEFYFDAYQKTKNYSATCVRVYAADFSSLNSLDESASIDMPPRNIEAHQRLPHAYVAPWHSCLPVCIGGNNIAYGSNLLLNYTHSPPRSERTALNYTESFPKLTPTPTFRIIFAISVLHCSKRASTGHMTRMRIQ